MKTLKKLEQYIDQVLTRWALNYIDKVSKTLYPKPYLEEKPTKDLTLSYDNEEEEEPTLFI